MGMKEGINNLSKGSRGFTLLEVCIAMAVLAVALLGVTSMQVNAVRNVTVGNLYSQANAVANQRVEYVKTIPLDILDASWSDPAGTVELNLAANEDSPPIFTRTTKIFGPADVPELVDTKFCRLIEVTVSWIAGGGFGTVRRTVKVTALTRGEGI